MQQKNYKLKKYIIMKTSESTLSSPLQPGSIEVKLSLGKLSLKMLFLYIVFMFAGSAAYVYIWEDPSAYGYVNYIIEFWSPYALTSLLFVFLIYIPLQAFLLFEANGRKWKELRWRCNWAGAGFYSRCPVVLKKFRVTLLLPGILLGVLPTLHGFCSGHSFAYIFGLVGIVCSISDFFFFYNLRPFHDDDLYQAGRNELQGKVIRRGA